jgi:hypothetical protein
VDTSEDRPGRGNYRRPPPGEPARFNHAGRLYYLGTFPTAAVAATAEARGLMLAEAGMTPREVREAVRRGWLLTLPELARVVRRFVVMPVAAQCRRPRPLPVRPARPGEPDPHLILLEDGPVILLQSPRARRFADDPLTASAVGAYTLFPPWVGSYGQIAAGPAVIRRLVALAVLLGLSVGVGALEPGRSAR